MTGEARYGWKHSISPRKEDLIFDPDEEDQVRRMWRRTRISITLRRVKPGGEIVGNG